MQTRTRSALCGALMATAGGAQAAVINVPGDTATIQGAIDMAMHGDEIVVAAGSYFESIDFSGMAVTVRSADGPDVTTIDATGLDDSVVHAISDEEGNSVLDGFTLTGGNPNGAAPDERGGAIYCDNSGPTIVNCVLINNAALVAGGGLYANAAYPTVTDCLFIGNSSANGGGAYVNASDVEFTNCLFEANAAVGNGGGLLTHDTTATCTDCTFTMNSAGTFGGGLIARENSMVTLRRVEIRDNVADQAGAIMANPASTVTAYDVILADNSAASSGGATWSGTGSTITLVGATVSGNASPVAGGLVTTPSSMSFVHNSIIWGNNGGQEIAGGGVTTVLYSNVQGGWVGTGNIDADPLFVDAAAGDYHLQAGSPANDAADYSLLESWSGFPLDLDGNPRITNDPDAPDTGPGVASVVLDMGAYELPCIVEGDDSCPADLDGSGNVGTADLLALLAAWGSCP